MFERLVDPILACVKVVSRICEAGKDLSIHRDGDIVARVPRLIVRCGPAAILRGVAEGVVNPVEAEFRAESSSVSPVQESRCVMPLFANGDAAIKVATPLVIVRGPAPTHHSSPSPVGWMPGDTNGSFACFVRAGLASAIRFFERVRSDGPLLAARWARSLNGCPDPLRVDASAACCATPTFGYAAAWELVSVRLKSVYWLGFQALFAFFHHALSAPQIMRNGTHFMAHRKVYPA